jgi:peroxiredoxin
MEAILIISSVALWVAVGLNLIITLALVRRLNQASGMPGGLKKGTPAPGFTAQTLGGETVTLADYANRSAAFVFIATNCRPCREEAPKLEVLAAAAHRAGVELVLVSIDEAAETEEFVKELELTLPVLVAPQASNPFKKDYQIPGNPFYCLIDARGKIQSTGFPNTLGGEWEKLAESWQANQGRVPDMATA